MVVSYPARDMFYSQRDRPNTVVRVSVKPGVFGASPRIVLGLVLIRGLWWREKRTESIATGTQQASCLAYEGIQRGDVVVVHGNFPIEPHSIAPGAIKRNFREPVFDQTRRSRYINSRIANTTVHSLHPHFIYEFFKQTKLIFPSQKLSDIFLPIVVCNNERNSVPLYFSR